VNSQDLYDFPFGPTITANSLPVFKESILFSTLVI
jgi:hypothetical protein